MEIRNRNFGESNYSGSFMFGAASPNVRQSVTPMVTRGSPLGTNRPPSPATARQRRIEPELKSGTTAKKVRKPPLSSVLDDGQIGSSTPINEHTRASHQFSARGPDAPAHHLFTGSPPPRKYGYDLSMSLEDPFERKDDTSTLHSINLDTNADMRSQFGTPYQPSARRFANSMQSTGTVDQIGMSLSNTQLLTLGQFSHAQQDAGWNCWIMVHGYHISDSNSNEAILQRFQEYGTIDRYSPSSGNWIFIRYESSIMADRALSQNGTFFNSNTIIAVTKLNPNIAKYMNLQLARDGSLTQGEVDVSVIYNADQISEVTEKASLISRKNGKRVTRGKYEVSESESGDSKSSVDSADDQSLYLRPYRTKSICTKIMEYFFSY